jgi:mannosyltransferase
VLTRDRWERADRVVAFLLAEQRPGEPVVAVEGRSAAGLSHYAVGTRLVADVRLPPDDPPVGAQRVWLVRQLLADGSTRPSDDDDVLVGQGLRLVRTELFRAVKTDLVVQLWSR